jgi:hypothetical protein
MIKLLSTLVVLSVLATCVAGDWGYVQSNITIPTNPGNFSISYTVGAVNTSFAWVHCFGEINVYIAPGYTPNATNNAVSVPWSSGQHSFFEFGPIANVTAVFTFACTGSYSPVCATLDLLWYTQPTVLTDFVPTPTNAALTGTLASHSAGSVTFSKTSNVSDTYNIYWTTALQPPTGYYASTACGIVAYMNTLTSANGYVASTNPQNETLNLNFTNGAAFTVAVVVNRPGGYPNVYDTFTLNSGYTLIPSVVMLMMVIFAALF